MQQDDLVNHLLGCLHSDGSQYEEKRESAEQSRGENPEFRASALSDTALDPVEVQSKACPSAHHDSLLETARKNNLMTINSGTMTKHGIDHECTDTKLTRRGFVTAAGGTLTVGLAGCSGITQQSFEATTVALPSAAREELWLSETARDAETVSREGPAGSEVEITNKATVYSRAGWLEEG